MPSTTASRIPSSCASRPSRVSRSTSAVMLFGRSSHPRRLLSSGTGSGDQSWKSFSHSRLPNPSSRHRASRASTAAVYPPNRRSP